MLVSSDKVGESGSRLVNVVFSLKPIFEPASYQRVDKRVG